MSDFNNQHSITPPPELVQQWVSLACEYEGNETWIDLATQAAEWGADQELEACCAWANATGWEGAGDSLRADRRPKPPSLKERALDALDTLNSDCILEGFECPEKVAVIRRALEQLDD